MQIPPPPDWVREWAGVLGGAAFLGAAGYAWKWMTTPFKRLKHRVYRLRRAFKKESFALREQMTTIMGLSVDNEHNIEGLKEILTRIEQSMHANDQRVCERLDDICSDIVEIRERLSNLEGAREVGK